MDKSLPPSPSPETAAAEEIEEGKTPANSRRSTRTRRSRLPAPLSAPPPLPTPKSISVRRPEGGEPVILKKTEAQALGLLTRNNTRRNKQGAFSVSLRLAKLNLDAASTAVEETTSLTLEPQPGKKSVRWDETLAYYQTDPTTVADALAEAESLATPDELSLSVSTPSSQKTPKLRKERSETPRIRRVRGLGAANGTPGKGLLTAASMLPDGATDEQDSTAAAAEKPQGVPKASRLKKLVIAPGASSASEPRPTSRLAEPSLQALDVVPIGVGPAGNSPTAPTSLRRDRKSRLATPRRVKLPQPGWAATSGPSSSSASSIPTAPPPVEARDKQIQAQAQAPSQTQAQMRRLGGATNKKGVKADGGGVAESGLPRRRAGASAGTARG